MLATLATTLLVVAACSSRPSEVGTAGDSAASDATRTIAFTVDNDLIPARSIIVTFHANGAREQLLGSVPASETRTFTIENRHAIPPYHLVAEPSGGSDIVSRRIDASTANAVSWSLATNEIRIDN